MIENEAYIKRTINQLINDKELTKDLYQDLCLKLLQKKNFVNRKSWIKIVVNNFVIDYYRTINKKSIISIEREVNEDDLIKEEEKDYQELYNMIEKLPEDLKEALILKYFTKLKYDEITKILKIPKQTIVSRVHRAVNRLKTSIKK